jgi:hypothetical protein
MSEGNGRALEPFGLHHDPWGRLVLTLPDGRQVVGASAVRAFPISDPEHGIAFCDAEGREVVWVEDLGGLSPLLREALEEELARRRLLPTIRRVLRISAPVEPSEWEVETDRGRTRFLLNSEDDVHRLDGARALITDTHGLRYLIPDTEALDATSRRLLERFL